MKLFAVIVAAGALAAGAAAETADAGLWPANCKKVGQPLNAECVDTHLNNLNTRVNQTNARINGIVNNRLVPAEDAVNVLDYCLWSYAPWDAAVDDGTGYLTVGFGGGFSFADDMWVAGINPDCMGFADSSSALERSKQEPRKLTVEELAIRK